MTDILAQTIRQAVRRPEVIEAVCNALEAQLQRELSELIRDELTDPRIGKLTVTDVDTNDTVSSTVTLASFTGPNGGLSNAQLLSYFSVTPAAGLAANVGDVNNLTWNFNSGMGAIDAALSHLVGYQDVVLSSRNIYGGAYQLLHDWFGKRSNLDVGVVFFDGFTAGDFTKALAGVRKQYADRLKAGRKVYVYLESPCNPHGVFLDVPGICAAAHAAGLTVICDATVGTPFLVRPLQQKDPAERPDYIIHSYTKDLTGHGTTTAGVVIGRNEDMFLPKGDTSPSGKSWHDTLFWNVYYIKGAFLDSDKAFEVLTGMKTLELRMLQKCISTATSPLPWHASQRPPLTLKLKRPAA